LITENQNQVSLESVLSNKIQKQSHLSYS